MKNLTFAIGLGWLIYGALFFDYQDWDIGVSLVMAFSTYYFADKVWNDIGLFYRILKLQPPREILYLMVPVFTPLVLATWWCVDGSYWVYWSIVNPSVMIREGQWPMSLCLFLLCGAIWSALAKYPCSWQGVGLAMRELRLVLQRQHS